MPQHWKIGELGKLTGLTVRTLRFYDQIGLFSPSGHSDRGHRLYNDTDIKQLHQVLSLKDLGLSLEEIQSVLRGHTYTPSAIVNIQIERIRKHIKTQHKLLAELERIAELMNRQEPPSVEEFIAILETMKMRHETSIISHRLNWEHHFDQLGDFLNKH